MSGELSTNVVAGLDHSFWLITGVGRLLFENFCVHPPSLGADMAESPHLESNRYRSCDAALGRREGRHEFSPDGMVG